MFQDKFLKISSVTLNISIKQIFKNFLIKIIQNSNEDPKNYVALLIVFDVNLYTIL